MPIPSQSSADPPIPSYIFRHHNKPVHALHFFHNNNFFASGDSSGLLVIWRLVTRRPVSVFQAHDAGIMGIKDWGGGRRLITHGRDHKLRVWEIKAADLEGAWKGPAQTSISSAQEEMGTGGEGQKPWLLHSMSVNALNFCAFSICPMPDSSSRSANTAIPNSKTTSAVEHDSEAEVEAEPVPELISNITPNTINEITNTKQELETITNAESTPAPLLLASPNGLDSSGIDIFHLPTEHRISQIRSTKDTKTGMVMALSLSFDASQNRLLLVSGYEDGSVAVHEVTDLKAMNPSTPSTWTWKWTRILTSRPHSQPVLSLDVTPDCLAFITSSADAIIAKFVVPPSTDTELVVGSSAPERTINTKHAGQQDLKIRSDGKIFVTAGWDGSLRVYSVKTCKELAVLQWHKEGCYAVAFAKILVAGVNGDESGKEGTLGQGLILMSAMDKMKLERDKKIHNTHWIVAGSKDGKISLWDIY